jgi:uncharacterized repeat protein (TIGR03803 family)
MKKLLIVLFTFTFSLFTALCSAQFTDIVTFTGQSAPDSGSLPTGNVVRLGNLLYSTAIGGGAYNQGVLISMDTNGNNYRVLWDFGANSADGNGPLGNLLFLGGKFYGMTQFGGANDKGSIYSIDTNGTNYNILWSFAAGGGTNGSVPNGSLTFSSGILYGMTLTGGANSSGNVFSIDTNGTNYTDLQDFASGSSPHGSLNFLGGKLYGMSTSGGAHSEGFIFSMDSNGANDKDIWDFEGGGDTNGDTPLFTYFSVVGGKLYGMTAAGGLNNVGLIFSIDTNGNNYHDLFNFDGTNGELPYGSLIVSGSTLYGMTQEGGTYNDGNVFSLDTNGSGFRNLFDFDGTNGSAPYGSLAISNGVLYGTASGGGTPNDGVVFSYVPITATATSTNVTCISGSNGIANVNVNGGISPYTYQWNDGLSQAAATATGLTVGTYKVYVYDNNHIEDSAVVSIAQPSELRDSVSVTNVICNGGSGSATANVGGGGTPYTYMWSDANSQTTATATGLVAGTYSVSIKDACGADSVVNISITQPTIFSASVSTTANITCYGANTGSASASVSGGTAPYYYTWTNGAGTNATATGLTAGTYSVYITDACGGAPLSASVEITQPNMLSVSTSTTANVTCYNGNNGSASATVSGGTSPYTYAWSDAGSQTTANAVGLSVGSYTVTITDACGGDITSAGVIITQPNILSISASTTANVICYGTNTGSASATVSGGTSPYTYLWSDANSQSTITATGLVAGTYTVTITDACGSDLSTAGAVISGPSLLSVSAITTANASCGNIGSASSSVSGGTMPYTYLWNDANSQTTANAVGLSVGSYTVTITDACGGDMATAGVIISGPSMLAATAVITANITCYGTNTGSASATVSGGTSPYYYTWTPSGGTNANATGLTAGTYSVYITDACGGAPISASVEISQPAGLNVSASATANVTCNGDDNGSASSAVSGGATPYTYLWSDPGTQSTASATGLSAGVYTVTITDACGTDMATTTISITQPNALTVGVFDESISCYNGDNGSIYSHVHGGTQPYTYQWTGGVNTPDLTGLSAGTYTLGITDNNNCSNSVTVIITQPATALSISTYSQDDNGSANGIATVTASGGTSPYTYSWAPEGQTVNTITGLSAGSYCCNVTDANGCTESTCVTVSSSLGIDNISNLSGINIYPNPTISSFTITGVTQGQVIELYNYIGQRISSNIVSNVTTMHFDISDKANGVYLIRILNTDGTLVTEKKMIKTQ